MKVVQTSAHEIVYVAAYMLLHTHIIRFTRCKPNKILYTLYYHLHLCVTYSNRFYSAHTWIHSVFKHSSDIAHCSCVSWCTRTEKPKSPYQNTTNTNISCSEPYHLSFTRFLSVILTHSFESKLDSNAAANFNFFSVSLLIQVNEKYCTKKYMRNYARVKKKQIKYTYTNHLEKKIALNR